MAKQREKTVTGRVLHDPVKDKLRPMFPLDLSKCRTVDELVRAMGDTAFTGRQIGDAADVFEQMARDKDWWRQPVTRIFGTTPIWMIRNFSMRGTTGSTIRSSRRRISITSKR